MNDLMAQTLSYAAALQAMLLRVSSIASCRKSINAHDHTWVIFTVYTVPEQVGVFCTSCGCDAVFPLPHDEFMQVLRSPLDRAVDVDGVVLIRHRLRKWKSEVDAVLDHAGGIHHLYK